MDIKKHLEDDVLHWWLDHGPDMGAGGVRTCWDNRGQHLVSEDRYTWSQGRWAWLASQVELAARAGLLDVDPEPWHATAVGTATFVADHAVLPDGSTAFKVSPEGEPLPVDGALHVSVFADLFAALGWSGVARVNTDRDWLTLGTDMLVSAADRYRAGTYRTEPYPVPAGRGTHALPLMLLGVGEQLVRAGAGQRALDVVVAALDELDARYWGEGGDVVEMPSMTPGEQDSTLLGRHRCPGHVLEAVWFAAHARDLAPDHPAVQIDRLTEMALRACRLGWDNEHGGLLRYVDVEGGPPRGDLIDSPTEPLVQRTWDTKLWWTHAEAVYALTLLGTLSSDPDVAHWRDRFTQYTFTVFPQGPGQEWIQNRTRDGKPLDEVVALPVKDPMHIARALLYLVELDATTTEKKEVSSE